MFLTVCRMECLCFLGLARSTGCKLFHAGIFVKSVLPPESPASPFYRSPLCSQFLEHHALSGLRDFMRLLCLVIISLVSAEQPRLPAVPWLFSFGLSGCTPNPRRLNPGQTLCSGIHPGALLQYCKQGSYLSLKGELPIFT